MAGRAGGRGRRRVREQEGEGADEEEGRKNYDSVDDDKNDEREKKR